MKKSDFTIECPECGEPVEIWWDPGEPMVMYYPDGSGYPGSPAGVECYEANCDHLTEEQIEELAWADIERRGDDFDDCESEDIEYE